MELRCPCCHTRYSLDAALQQEAASGLMHLLSSQQPELARALTSYLGLFRARNRWLSWGRAWRLAQGVLALTEREGCLTLALLETTEAIWKKRPQEPSRPLSNHNYLKRVLESILSQQRVQQRVQSGQPEQPPAAQPRQAPPEVRARRVPLLKRAGQLQRLSPTQKGFYRHPEMEETMRKHGLLGDKA